ncbi:MunI family type II restriction endonuclease [uncultured Ruminococcus sp.]|uniref:MunI family type II restriction endonuclease n=1 Tax=uncultured Ruminococcus sp. TaxID=165186 RepID=UPI0025D17388|nr:MunI family type II restriction endonuclease [uncultured Ruminococcus sp.]
MATQELRKRANWQTISGAKALRTEELFQFSLQSALDEVYPNKFIVDRHPKEFGNIYSTYPLSQEVREKIYDVDVSEKKANGKPKYEWGISMDFAIRNKDNGKILFGEIKRQDGWVETTNMAAGRGNAHERSCKYFTPGLMKIIRETGGLSEEILPFWLVIVGDITRDPRRNREIAYWFQEYTKNYYMWRDTNDVGDMLDFFENNLLPYLL